MKNNRKVITNAVIFFGVFALTLWSVFHGEDLGEISEALLDCDVRWLIPAIFCVFLFIFGESIIIWYLLRSCGIYVKEGICFLFSSVGFFFSCVTPSASGGQPMQVYFMKKEKIPIPISTVILLVVTITYKLVLVVTGLGLAFFDAPFMDRYLGDIIPVFYFGIFLNAVTVTGMIVLVFHPSLATRFLYLCVQLLEKLHILKHKENRFQKLESSMSSYHDTASYMKSHIGLILQVFVITFLQRLALFSVPCFVYKAFHLSGVSWPVILCLQACIAVAVDMLPLPGGMGISETLFEIIFTPIFGELILPGMVLSRGLGYYSELLISAIFTLFAMFFFSYRKKKEQAQN
ncbi:MAG: flippase-like domain-containing protein [Clostridiales bacterium]|nr:flippase-like domain-containing protein [Candidatus Blautia equi]